MSDLFILMEHRMSPGQNQSPYRVLRMAINATSAETVANALGLKHSSTVHRMTDPLSGRPNPIKRLGDLLAVLMGEPLLVREIFEYLAWRCGGIYVLSQDELSNHWKLQEALNDDSAKRAV
jgi:hypothetical protein